MGQKIRLGLFIVGTLLILATAIFLIGSGEAKFKSSYRLKAEFPNVAGLQEGAQVRVGGLPEGTVKYIQLPKKPDGKVTVVMDLAKDTQGIVKSDSTAAIKSEGLLGDKFVEVSFGSDSGASLKGGELIGSEPPFDISDLIAKANGLLDSAKDTMGNINGMTGNLKQITAKVNGGQGTVGALVNDKTMYREATASVQSMHDDLEALKHNFLLRGFFNKRGYVDADELKKHEIESVPSSTATKTFQFDAKQIFDKEGSAKLKNGKALKEAGEYLQTQKFGLAVIEATAGMKGDSDKDRLLTEARSLVVRNYLIQNFRLDDTRVKTLGLGKSEDSTDDGSVKILIYAEASK